MNESSFRELISGQPRGPAAALLRGCLRLLSGAYRAAIAARNASYTSGLRRVHRVPVPVVSVGNITTGGTGKTPLAAHLCRWFTQRGVRVVLVSRGYRSLDDVANDEKLVLAELCPDVVHLQNPNRVEAARAACREHRAELILLDDGFQHRRLHRDLDIVLIDAVNPWGYGHVLPRGLLREPVTSLRRADLIVLTRCDQVSDEDRQRIDSRLSAVRADALRVEAAFLPQRLRSADGRFAELESLAGHKVAAFCGIGNPRGFTILLERNGCLLDSNNFHVFPDHHHYSDGELTTVGEQARREKCSAILTTQKDLVKLNRTELSGCPLWGVEIGTEIRGGAELLDECLNGMLRRIPGRSQARNAISP